MRRLHVRLATTSALAVATALFTAFFGGAALADPGNGHGNSANAPGHQKQEQPAQQPQQQAPQQQAPAQQPQQQQQAAPTTSSQPGVKPSSTTKHDTDTKVGDSPDVSKRYGNGSTAAQIAKSRGAPDSQPLHGPGNSQPHKTYDCVHKNNRSGGVDVHAIKHYSTTACSSTSEVQSKPETQKPETKPSTPVKTPEQPSEHKVTLCHATGSATNPFVMITVDYHALKNGHTGDKGDIIPPTTINGVTYSANWDATGQAIFNNGCKPVAPPVAKVETPAVPTTTTTVPSSSQTITTTTTGSALPQSSGGPIVVDNDSPALQHFAGCLVGTEDFYVLRGTDGVLYRLRSIGSLRDHVGETVDVAGRIDNSRREIDAQRQADLAQQVGVQLPQIGINVANVRTVSKGCATEPR